MGGLTQPDWSPCIYAALQLHLKLHATAEGMTDLLTTRMRQLRPRQSDADDRFQSMEISSSVHFSLSVWSDLQLNMKDSIPCSPLV